MADLKKSSNLDDQEVEKLRSAVLKWIEAKPEDPAVTAKPKKTATPKPTAPKIKPQLEKSVQLPSVKSSIRPETKTSQPKLKVSKKISWFKLTISLIAIAILALIIFGAGIYYFKWDNPVVLSITKIIPYPAVIYNNQVTSYYDWASQVKSLRNFYDRQKSITPELDVPNLKDTQKHVLDRVIEKFLLETGAKNYGIKVTADEINQETEQLAKEIGSWDALKNQLNQLYGWDVNEFQKEIVRPLLLKNKLKKALILDERFSQKEIQKANEVLALAKTEGNAFDQLAIQYSEEATGPQGGDLGFLSPNQLMPEFKDAIINLEPGQISEVIKTTLGYHIVKIEEKLMDDNNEITQIRVRHILIKARDLNQYLTELKTKSTIIKFVIL
ncbi:MAG: peptidylprolyl isomerase [Candidatus Buchananbacteria bacterium]